MERLPNCVNIEATHPTANDSTMTATTDHDDPPRLSSLRVTLAILLALLLGSLCASLVGCGGSESQAEQIDDPGKLLESYDRSRRRHDPIRFEEVDLGKFFTTKYVKDQGTYTVSFHLYAIVDKKHRQELVDSKAKREKRMRDAIFTTLAKTELEYFREPTLGWIRSELMTSINRSLQSRVIRDVVFGEFSFERT